MGTRINVIIGTDRKKSPVVFANSHHNDVDLDQIIRELSIESSSDEEFYSKILDVTYPSDWGQHKRGDNVFSVDNEPGDHDKVFAVHGFSAPLALSEFGDNFDWSSNESLY